MVMVELDTVLPVIALLMFLCVFLVILVVMNWKYILLQLKRGLGRGYGCEIIVYDSSKRTYKMDFVKEIKDFKMDESLLEAISSAAPNEAVNPVEVPKIPYAKSETTGLPGYFFFRGYRKSFDPFAKVPFISDTTSRRHNYLNVWNLRGLYDSTFAGSTFNKIALVAFLFLGILMVANLAMMNDQNEKLIIPIKADTGETLTQVRRVNDNYSGIINDLNQNRYIISQQGIQ